MQKVQTITTLDMSFNRDFVPRSPQLLLSNFLSRARSRILIRKVYLRNSLQKVRHLFFSPTTLHRLYLKTMFSHLRRIKVLNSYWKIDECFLFAPQGAPGCKEHFAIECHITETKVIKGGKFPKKLWCCVGGRVYQGCNVIKWVDIVNLPPYRVLKLTFRALALRQSASGVHCIMVP